MLSIPGLKQRNTDLYKSPSIWAVFSNLKQKVNSNKILRTKPICLYNYIHLFEFKNSIRLWLKVWTITCTISQLPLNSSLKGQRSTRKTQIEIYPKQKVTFHLMTYSSSFSTKKTLNFSISSSKSFRKSLTSLLTTAPPSQTSWPTPSPSNLGRLHGGIWQSLGRISFNFFFKSL